MNYIDMFHVNFIWLIKDYFLPRLKGDEIDFVQDSTHFRLRILGTGCLIQKAPFDITRERIDQISTIH